MNKLTRVRMRRLLEQHSAAVCISLSIVVFLIVMALRASGKLQSLELLAYDQQLRWRAHDSAAENRIVLIGADDDDIRRFGWPIGDGTLAELLDRLAAFDPRAIGLDIYRDLPVPPGTQMLESTLLRHDNIVATMKFASRDGVGIAAPPVLRGSDRLGFTDVVVDHDGAVRRGLLFLDDGRDNHYSLALRLALRYLKHEGIEARPGEADPAHLRLGDVSLPPLESDDGGYTGADAAGYQFLLDFRAGKFARYSLRDVMSGKIDPETMRDKVIVVGVTADSVKDFFHVPLESGGNSSLYGIALHAHAVSQLLRAALQGQAPIRAIGNWCDVVWILAWSMLGALVAYRVRSLRRLSFAILAGIALLIGAAQGAFHFGWWIATVPATFAWLGSAGLVTAYLSYQEQEQRAILMQLFSRHVSPSVADLIWRQREQILEGGRLLPQKLMATVLFADLHGFTTLSEKLEPQTVMEWLNTYIESMARVVGEHNGVVNKFIGDAIMSVFGAPLPHLATAEIGQDAKNAVRCALGMGRELDRLNAFWEARGQSPAAIRVGIFTGPLVAGSLGSMERMEYTVIGDTVNTASRLETYDKNMAVAGQCRILVGASTMQYLEGEFDAVAVGRMHLKGKSEEVLVYLITGETGISGAKLIKEEAK